MIVAKARLVAEILWSAVRARLALRGENLPSVVKRLRDDVLQGRPRRGAVDPHWLGYAVHRTLRLLRVRCLVESLTLCTMLARRGVPSTVVIGVQPGERFGAHAWVELDGQVVLPGGSGGFARLVEV